MKPFSSRLVRCLWTVAGASEQTEPVANLLETWRIPVLLDEFLEIVENLTLAFGQRLLHRALHYVSSR